MALAVVAPPKVIAAAKIRGESFRIGILHAVVQIRLIYFQVAPALAAVSPAQTLHAFLLSMCSLQQGPSLEEIRIANDEDNETLFIIKRLYNIHVMTILKRMNQQAEMIDN